MDIQDSKGLIPVERFAEQKGMEVDKVIRMIKDGFYSGRLIEGQWYVDGSEETELSLSKADGNKKYSKSIANVIYVFGWITIAWSIVWLIWGAWNILSHTFNVDWHVMNISMAIMPAIGLLTTGVVMLAAGQVMRAVFDIANNSTDLLGLLRQREAVRLKSDA